MKKTQAIIMSGYGLNCEEETKFAFELAGGEAHIVHINDLIAKEVSLSDYNVLVFPGGFSYGDDTGSGNAFANKMKNHLWKDLQLFIQRDTLILGICNGFQILVNLGLLPAVENKYGDRQVGLLHNDNARYTVRWVDIECNSTSPFLYNVDMLSLPIAHGEGKFFAHPKVLDILTKNKQVASRYVKGELCEYQSLPENPNGSLDNIAGITDTTGRIFGLMPHPERAIFFHQLPHYTFLREKYKREGRELPEIGPGLQIFQNAVRYFD